jgi:hypothetical protein
MMRILVLVAAVWIPFVGCTGADTLSDAKSAELGCDQAFAQELPSFRIANNAWNKERAGTYAVRQCIRIRDGAHGPEYGWAWDWPAESDTLLSFPQVIFGWKPWDGGASSHPELPIQIATIDKLRLSYAVETRATGKHSLATTLWLTRSGVTGTEPNPKDISTDLMIWTDGFAFDPFGTQVGHTSIDGLDFEVWLARDLGDDSADGPRWNYVAYRSVSTHPGASLDLNAFLQHAVEQGFISSHHYVSDVEVGNEIMSGAGETWIKAIDLDVERRTRAAQ